MALPEETSQQVIEALRSHARLGKCPACGSDHWVMAGGFMTLPLADGAGGDPAGGSALPCAAIVCKHCGNTLLFNLVVLGLADLTAVA